eukprot:6800926-Pyramimonas_sp.AAC.1
MAAGGADDVVVDCVAVPASPTSPVWDHRDDDDIVGDEDMGIIVPSPFIASAVAVMADLERSPPFLDAVARGVHNVSTIRQETP